MGFAEFIIGPRVARTRWLYPSYGPSIVVALLLLAASPALAAGEADAVPKGAAVTVLKASKFCFGNIVEVSGIVLPRDEQQIRPDRFGLKVAEVKADPGDTVTAGQVLARLTDGANAINLTAPVAGTISASTAIVGAPASGKDALFSIIARNEYDLVGMVPTRDIAKLKTEQTARLKIIGAGDMDGKVRTIAPTIEPNSQLGQVFVGITSNKRLLVNSSGRAQITTGQSCGVAVPLTAILYSTAGTVVQVVRGGRVETRRVETGLMSAGQVEIRDGIQEGDIVVARAGALLREGDPVRPVGASADAK
ncbi:efflux RND transporter periplasmic adaptor subunit [Bradyrhizobium sp. JR3.5]